MNETPDKVHGRLLESIHLSGYSFERASQEFEWLLEEDRWKKIGHGYDDIDKFIETIDFSEFKISIEKRKKISKKLADLRATQRAAAKLLGVTPMTINRDVTNVTEEDSESASIEAKLVDVVTNVTTPPSPITQSGIEVAEMVIKAAAKEEKKRQPTEKEIYDEESFVGHEYRIGDFRTELSDISENSVDLILTDPPYGEKSIDLYHDLGVFAARTLKPGGSLLTYTGQATLPDILNVLSENLRYWWTLCLEHSAAGQQLPGKWVYVKWKPIVWFVKENRNGRLYVIDRLRGDEPEKEKHAWAQGISEVRHLIEQLTVKDNLIIDPFAGTGNWGKLAGTMGRRWIGCDLEIGGGVNK